MQLHSTPPHAAAQYTTVSSYIHLDIVYHWISVGGAGRESLNGIALYISVEVVSDFHQ